LVFFASHAKMFPMDPELKRALDETLKLSRENNQMLQAMRRSMRLGRIMSFLYWALIIGTAFGAYYFIQPYIDQLMGVYGGAKSNLDGMGSILDDFR